VGPNVDQSADAIKQGALLDRIGFGRSQALEDISLSDLVFLNADLHRRLSVVEALSHRQFESILRLEVDGLASERIGEILFGGIVRPTGLDEAALPDRNVKTGVRERVQRRLPGGV